MSFLTVAVCTYNRSARLPGVVDALRKQKCPLSFEILIVDNNSSDKTQEVLARLSSMEGAPLRFVKEMKQGIVPARNRALEESMRSDYMVFIDDDELPHSGMLAAAVDALNREGAEFVGGRVVVPFAPGERPTWLGDELLGFLAEVNYGNEPFWITDDSTPVWTSNAAYRTELFRDGLHFDSRYNREGKFGFGGEDGVMFETLLKRGVRIRYRPDMVVEHYVEKWRLKRNYFLKLHYTAGVKRGRWGTGEYARTILGVPPFMVTQAVRQGLKTVGTAINGRTGVVRQGMNATFHLGMIVGRFLKWREREQR